MNINGHIKSKMTHNTSTDITLLIALDMLFNVMDVFTAMEPWNQCCLVCREGFVDYDFLRGGRLMIIVKKGEAGFM
jgi:hypothetical protein